MKIYEIGTGYTPIPAQMGAATEIVVEELTRAFLKQGRNVQIVDIAAEDRVGTNLPIIEVPVPKCFRGTDVKLGLMHKLKRVVYSVSLAFTLRRLLKNSQEKVVLHFHNQYNLFFFLKLVPDVLRKKAFVVYTNHSYIWHSRWKEIEDTVRKRYFQEIYCMKHANCVFVLNQQTKKTVEEHLAVDPRRVHLIANGVNTDTYFPISQEKKAQNKNQWGLRDKRVFIQVGSVCDRKNQLSSVKWLLPLMQEEKDLVFCYAGGIIEPEYHEAVQKFAADQGVSDRVLYVGELKPGPQLNRFYNLAEAMIFPSKAEGFSLVILEAMSAGTPVLIGDNLQFSLAENCIAFVQNEFSAAVREQILRKDRRKALSGAVREAIVREYGWDAVAQEYAAIWQTGLVDM